MSKIRVLDIPDYEADAHRLLVEMQGQIKYPVVNKAFRLNDGDPCARSILQPMGMHEGVKCGYCGRSSTHTIFGMFGLRMEPEVYQELMFRGWRRSGRLLYLIDYARSCCPHYTIRLEVAKFLPTKHQRKLLYSMHKYVYTGNGGSSQKQQPAVAINKGPLTDPQQLADLVQACDADRAHGAAREFKVTIEKGSFTAEKFALYSKYQKIVHHDSISDEGTFNRFLCSSSITYQPIDGMPSDSPITEYGLYHQLYCIDGKLVAMGVLDVLPRSVSAVYFVYDTDYKHLSLGHYSSLREIALTQYLGRFAPDLKYYCMGYYIHTCPKMSYKGQYHPSELLDVVSQTWVPIEDARPLIEQAPHFTTFVPDPKTGKHIQRTQLEQVLTDIQPGLDYSHLSADQQRDLMAQTVVIDGVVATTADLCVDSDSDDSSNDSDDLGRDNSKVADRFLKTYFGVGPYVMEQSLLNMASKLVFMTGK
ncbi:Arginyl-tRNA--protein transferase 1 [Spiromyces aspiralis]|uniref:Arginyl-tRNA--protein transferase 1 n=1 Tax=Spiromyces aspiralis TaxID=68401 RepID=A0ACC1HTZ4_9FUNG|nr:Arginyl-tRNA--protein transferase 1 [Spiromyces aspiralis]